VKGVETTKTPIAGSFALWGRYAILAFDKSKTPRCQRGAFLPDQMVSHLTGTVNIVAKLRRLVK
jgi:hypothetical protein